MKILKLSVKGLPLFKQALDVEFIAQQRVDDDDREQLYNVFSSIYTNPVLAFIGINASGKTTILKVISFVMELLNNKALNTIHSKEIFDDLDHDQEAIITTYFYHDGVVNKLESIIKKRISSVDEKEKIIIADETLWEKPISKIRTKKGLYEFADSEIKEKRNQNEQYLIEDISIIVALNKKYNMGLYLSDTSESTDHNILKIFGGYHKEILAFLDPSIEYLHCKFIEKKADIKLKFYGRDEINIDQPQALNKYLSSGTIKGLNIFIESMVVFSKGGYLVVDELENHFNREIVSTLIRFFMDKKINKHGATLIFSTHYSELLNEFERNDSIYIVKNRDGITADNLSGVLKRNDIKKSEVYDSDFLKGTVPIYESYMALKKVLMLLK